MRAFLSALTATALVSGVAHAQTPPAGETWGYELSGTTAKSYFYPASNIAPPRSGAFAEIGIITFGGNDRVIIKFAYARPGFPIAEWMNTSCEVSGSKETVSLDRCDPIPSAETLEIELPGIIHLAGLAIIETRQTGSRSIGVTNLIGHAWLMNAPGQAAPELAGNYSGASATLYSLHSEPATNAVEMDVPPYSSRQALPGMTPKDGWVVSTSGKVFLHGAFQSMTNYFRATGDGTGTGYWQNPTDLRGIPGRFHFVTGHNGDFMSCIAAFVPGGQEKLADPDAVMSVRHARLERK